ncbi:MAG: hypothetical protein AAGG07_12595 [Planctomycetota bacterium]
MTHAEHLSGTGSDTVIERKPGGSGPCFRADTDAAGRWHVWRRVSASSWATLQRCSCRDEAERLASEMNGAALPA